MNVADSQRVASELERLGYRPTRKAEQADVVVLNTCVVRQSAEDRAFGRLSSLSSIKEQRPDLVLNVMGCMVGVKGNRELEARFPYVDVFSAPSDPAPLIEHLVQTEARILELQNTSDRFAFMEGDFRLPMNGDGPVISAHVPVVYGCSHACTFCIIPFRRGVERSRSLREIVAEARTLAVQGVREVTLLGQIVDRYGMDIEGGPILPDLLRAISEVEGIHRIRFLTSHPNWMSEDLISTVAELDNVCAHIEVPVQAGDDEILEQMRRGYTADDYRRLIDRIRERLPEGSIATDIIVGFPGETDAQYQRTFDLLSELQLDVAHLARYSPRPQTVAERRMVDDVPEAVKMQRFRELEELQERISAKINAGYVGQEVEILVERQRRGQWVGRTETNKLVFTDSEEDLAGQLIRVHVDHAGPWSLRGSMIGKCSKQDLVPLPVYS